MDLNSELECMMFFQNKIIKSKTKLRLSKATHWNLFIYFGGKREIGDLELFFRASYLKN